MKRLFACLLLGFFCSSEAHAFFTELGLSYGRKRTSFDADNYVDSESMTASLSIYFFEKLALELSYTDASGVREEKTAFSQQTVLQKTSVTGADLIWMLADRKSFFQPYLKGGAAQIRRKQEVKVQGFDTYTLEPETSIAPSYGIGFKLNFTDSFGIKIGYDAWKTPLGGGAFSNDDSLRAGVTWML